MQLRYNPNLPPLESDEQAKARRDLEAEVERLRKEVEKLKGEPYRLGHVPLVGGTSSTATPTTSLPSDGAQSIVDYSGNWVSLAVVSHHPIFIAVTPR
jgi:hypothetical protein